ncbi:hypothetical protein G9C98_008124 [Cotesia typhae]|uniref:Uncharacterized protein n=1 Tax=Cotesia typhae TaxID=2053667 RepID=A0A8J5V009_9HYME|nr:hypothetical protein G9C98_008124 [Cotesia typhae]
MNEESRCGELQQLVREEEEEENEETTINASGEATPPTTTSQGSMVSGKVNSHGNHHQVLQQSRVMYVNEKDKQRSSKSDFTSRTRQHRARMHFEIGQQQPRHQEKDTSGPGQSSANMRHLLHRLQQLSMCIEKLHNK